jgi:hypothetical protein
MIGFLRTIIIIAIIFYAIKLIAKYVMPHLLKKMVNKMENNFYENYNHKNYKKEGEVIIEGEPKSNKQKKSNSKDKGEYIDYKEVNEN